MVYESNENAATQGLYDSKVDFLSTIVVEIAGKFNVRLIRDTLINELMPGEDGKVYRFVLNGSSYMTTIPVCDQV